MLRKYHWIVYELMVRLRKAHMYLFVDWLINRVYLMNT